MIPSVKLNTAPAAESTTARKVALFLAVLLAGYLLVESLIFRSGFYARFLEPQLSETGSLERTLDTELHRPPSGKKEILVIGNSRIAEGFSPKIANEDSAQDGYWFINLGVSGTGDRVWNYLVRDVDPHRNRYAAIAIPIDDYDDPDDYEDVADRASEMPFLVNRLRLTDILPYTLSFTSWKSRLQVFRGLVFEATTYQRDFQQFVEHPLRRLDRVKEFRKLGATYGYNYGGIHRSLAGLTVDWKHQHISFPPGVPEDLQYILTANCFGQPPQRQMNRTFEVRWLGALADLYRGSKTRIIFFQAPRSPVPRPVSLAHLPWTSVDELRKRPWVTVVDRRRFESLERPELFADHVHLSTDGRKIFSPMLVDTVKEILN